jgi:hypothetical protein
MCKKRFTAYFTSQFLSSPEKTEENCEKCISVLTASTGTLDENFSFNVIPPSSFTSSSKGPSAEAPDALQP